MAKTATYLVLLNCCIFLSPVVWGQCGYTATIRTNKNYCVGSSLIAQSTHALQSIVWYQNGQPVKTATGTQHLDSVPVILSLGNGNNNSNNDILRLCADGAGNIYVFNAGLPAVEIYSPGRYNDVF